MALQRPSQEESEDEIDVTLVNLKQRRGKLGFRSRLQVHYFGIRKQYETISYHNKIHYEK